MCKFRTIQKKNSVQQQGKKKESIITNNIFLSDVINIIYNIKSKRDKNIDSFDMVIYIHSCEKGKFYVGTSGQGPDAHSRMVNRLRQHLQPSGGSNFTRENKVVSCLAYFPTRSLYRFNEEDLITWLFEKIVGIGNVEGGYNLIRGRQLTFGK